MATLNFNAVNTWQGRDADLQRFLNTTRRNFIAYAVAQNLGRLSPVAKVLLDRADSRPFQPAWIIQPVVPDATNYNGPQYLTNDQFTINSTDPTVINAQFEASLMAQTIRVGMTELVSNQSPNAVIDQVLLKTSQATLKTMLELSERLATDDGNATVNQKFQGMRDVVDAGFFCGNFGQIDRATNTWWNSYVFDATALGAGTVPEFRVVQRAIVEYLEVTGGSFGMPNIAFCPFGTFQKIAESFQALEQYIVGDISSISQVREYETKGIIINGIPIFPEPNLTTYTNANNQTVGDIYFLNLENIQFTFAEPFSFYMSEWKDEFINGRLSWMSVMLVGGNIWSDRPRAHFMLKGVPSV